MKKGGHKQKKFNYFQNYAVDGYDNFCDYKFLGMILIEISFKN